jgi:hypothetical protein
MIKLVGTLIFPLSQRRRSTEEVEEGLDKTEFFVLATLNTFTKYLKRDLNTRTL